VAADPDELENADAHREEVPTSRRSAREPGARGSRVDPEDAITSGAPTAANTGR